MLKNFEKYKIENDKRNLKNLYIIKKEDEFLKKILNMKKIEYYLVFI